MMYLNIFLLALVAVFAMTEAVDVTVHVELDPVVPAGGLPVCSATFLTNFLNQLSGIVQKQVSHAAPDLIIGDFTLTHHATTIAQSTSVCDTCTKPGCVVACASAACTNCGTVELPNVITDAGFYEYLSETVQSLGRNYVIDPNVPDNGCLGDIAQLGFSVTLLPNKPFDGSNYPTVASVVAAW